MKRLLAISILSATFLQAEGHAYLDSMHCALSAPSIDSYRVLPPHGTARLGKYGRGDPEWDKKNQEWLDSDDDTPYPDDLNDIDGRGYEHSRDAGKNAKDYER